MPHLLYHVGRLQAGARGRCTINRQRPSNLGVILIALVLLTASCSGGQSAAPTPRPPTPIPPTPTPRSTPLPTLDQPPALLGSAQRPLVIGLAGPATGSMTRSAQSALAQAVADALQPVSETLNLAPDIEVEVQRMDEATALRALCSGAPVTAWVNAFTYVAAARACGAEPLLVLLRENEGEVKIGIAYDVIVSAGIRSAADLAGERYCRVEGQLEDWAFAALMLAAEGFDPLAQMSPLPAYDSETAALRALLDGECAALALAAGTLEDRLDELAAEDNTSPGEQEGVRVLIAGGDALLASESAGEPLALPRYVVPYGVWVAAPDSALPAGDDRPLRQELIAAVRAYFEENPSVLHRWFGASEVIAVDQTSLAALRAWLDGAAWDMADAP